MPSIDTIEKKIARRERLDKEDGLALLSCTDIVRLGQHAFTEKKRRFGDRVFFNVNCHINLTNVCVSRCAFCAFSKDAGQEGAYLMTLEDVIEKITRALSDGITEVHMVSGLHPDRPFSWYVEVVAVIHERFPNLHIKAFTPVELEYFSEISGMPVSGVITALKDAGLGSMPGGGAEVLSDRVRRELCPNKASSSRWLAIMKTAHRLGLKSNATLLYGHIETPEETIDHLLRIRSLQDETGGFQTFIPLPFHPANTALGHLEKPSACEMLRMFSLSRLMLDNVPHIKAYWIMTGLKTAQVALCFGADDIDGTVTEERITHAAGAQTASGLTKAELTGIIAEAGAVPVERDTLYNTVHTFAPPQPEGTSGEGRCARA
jgi:aminodeoxyfutalosine synthase